LFFIRQLNENLFLINQMDVIEDIQQNGLFNYLHLKIRRPPVLRAGSSGSYFSLKLHLLKTHFSLNFLFNFLPVFRDGCFKTGKSFIKSHP
jgi:hypothetical protein